MAGSVDYSGRSGGSRGMARVNFDEVNDFGSTIRRWPIDLLLLILFLGLIGGAALYSSTLTNPEEAGLAGKHLGRFIPGYIVMLALALLRPQWWMRIALPAYIGGVLLLIAVFIFGVKGGNAQRWIYIGPVSIQPSEFMKLALVLYLARWYQLHLDPGRRRLWVHLAALALIALPAALVAIQPDLGTALTLIAAGGAIVFFAGLSWRLIFLGVGTAIASAPAAYYFVLAEYQKRRVDTMIARLMGEDMDSLGDGYQSQQAEIAIGSGGWWGKGFTQGSQSQLDFIPEQHTDFILTVIAEEAGFVGVFCLMMIWGWIFIRALIFANQCVGEFNRFAAVGAMALIAFYVVFNTGMVMGIFPVVGVPMPLISYGGTAMLTVLVAFALIIAARVHKSEYFRPSGWI